MKMAYCWMRQCAVVVWLLYYLHYCVNSQHSDACVVNRNASTFECKFAVCNTTDNSSSTDIISNITFPNKNIISCNSSLNGDNADVACPFEKANNILTYIIKVLFRGCYTSLNLKPYTSVVPVLVHQVDITSPRGRKLLIQGSTDDPLMPISSERTINITVYQQTSDNNFVHVRQRSIIRQNHELKKAIIHLQPYANYRIEIIWRLSMSNLWSGKFVAYSMTVAARPTAAPQLLEGGYSYSEEREVVFYWQGIDKSKENGPQLEYIIYKIPRNDSLLYDLVMNFSTVRDLYQNYINSSLTPLYNDSTTLLQQYYMKSFNGSKCSGLLYGFQEEDIFIIRANNSFLPSTYYSAFKTYKTTDVRNPISSLFVDQKNTTHYKLRWSFDELFLNSIEYLHIYYCYGFHWKIEGWTECKETISNVTVEFLSAEMTNEILDPISPYSLFLQVEACNTTACSGCAIHFGISTESRNVSAPIFWNATDISKEVITPDEESINTTTIVIIVIASIISASLIGCLLYVIVSRCQRFWKKNYVIDNLVNLELPNGNAALSTRNNNYSEENRTRYNSLCSTEMSSYAIVTLDQIDSNGFRHSKELNENQIANGNIISELHNSKTNDISIIIGETIPANSQNTDDCVETCTNSVSTEQKQDKPHSEINKESDVSIGMIDLASSENESVPEIIESDSPMRNIIVDENDDYTVVSL